MQNINNLLKTYERVMLLNVYIDKNDSELKNLYIQHSNEHNYKIYNNNYIDAGFDLFTPGDKDEDENVLKYFGVGWPNAGPVNKIDFKVKCSAKMYLDSGKIYTTGYYLYPRSSLSKTRLRLANSTGIIDSGYRGNILGMFDIVNVDKTSDNKNREADYFGKKFDRYVQICAPGLVPIIVNVVDSVEELGNETERGECGFGSTNI
jgi:dUTP pyrophosphatase